MQQYTLKVIKVLEYVKKGNKSMKKKLVVLIKSEAKVKARSASFALLALKEPYLVIDYEIIACSLVPIS